MIAALVPHADQLAVDKDTPGIGYLQQVDAAQERALARAAAAEDGDHIVLAGGQRYTLEDLHVAETLEKILDHERRFGPCVGFRHALVASRPLAPIFGQFATTLISVAGFAKGKPGTCFA